MPIRGMNDPPVAVPLVMPTHGMSSRGPAMTVLRASGDSSQGGNALAEQRAECQQHVAG
jgi:hypothetical protein